jgi:hypothetical protein
MFVLRSAHRALQVDYQRVLEQRDEARRDARAALAASHLAAGQFTDTDEALDRVRLAKIRDAVTYRRRITRLLRTVAAYRSALTAETRRADRLQKAYDSAVGLDAPALDLGAQWQQRRTDKPAAVKP